MSISTDFIEGVAAAFCAVASPAGQAIRGGSSPDVWLRVLDTTEGPQETHREAATDWAGRFVGEGVSLGNALREAELETGESVRPYQFGWLVGLDAAGVHGWSWQHEPLSIPIVILSPLDTGIKVTY